MDVIETYLRRIGLEHPGPPSISGLFEIHRAHAERVPYENLDVYIGKVIPIQPQDSLDRIIKRRRGGHCYHLNGGLGALLEGLGYQVDYHRGGTQLPGLPPPGANGGHLVLTVSGLPSPESPDGLWYVDVGMGDGIYEPMPLVTGTYAQGPFTYGLRPSESVPGGWRFDHDTKANFVGMDWEAGLCTMTDLEERNYLACTSIKSPLIWYSVVIRRDATGIDLMGGCVLRRMENGNVDRELTSRKEWFEALADIFGLTLDDMTEAERDQLWNKITAAHEVWKAQQRAQAQASAN